MTSQNELQGATRVPNYHGGLAIIAVTVLLAVFALLDSTLATPVAATSVASLDALGSQLTATLSWQSVWHSTEQQRLCRLSALMQGMCKAESVSDLQAELTWYVANERPRYAAEDLQQLLRASARATADSVAGSPESVADSGLQYVGQSLFDFDQSSSSSPAKAADLFALAPDGYGPLLLHTLPDSLRTYEPLVEPNMKGDVAAAGASADCYDLFTKGSNNQHRLQLVNDVTADIAIATAELTSVDLLLAEDIISPAISRLARQSAPPVRRRARRLMAAAGASSSGQAEFAWLLGAGGRITGFAGNDGNLVSIEHLPVEYPTDTSSVAEAGAAVDTNSALPSVSLQQGQQDYRIIGGVEAPRDRYKWVCSLRGNNDFHYCGCSLIAPSVVLTAAHCLDQVDPALSMPWVEIGRYFLTGANDTDNSYDRIKCTKSVVNPGWSFDTGLNDVALCFLASASRFTPVKLVEEGGTPEPGTPVTVMGWGAQAEDGSNAAQLMQVQVDVTPLDSCNKAYQGAIKDTQICAGVSDGGKDACQGDSGGPLFLPGKDAEKDVQVGIVSYGVGCGRPQIPGVYTDISKYRSYITEQMLGNGISYPPVTGTGKAVAPNTTTPAVIANSGDGSGDPQCYCSSNGYSGSTFIGQMLSGCKQHGLDFGDTSFYCYAVGGLDCKAAAASNAYPGAAWLTCEPGSQPKETVAPAAAPAAPGSTSSSNSINLGGLLQSLQSWINFNALTNGTNATAADRVQFAAASAGDGNNSSPGGGVRDAVRRAVSMAEAGRR